MTFSCSRIKKTEAEYQREDWIQSFSDSISFYEEKNNEINDSLHLLQSEIEPLLNNFDFVNNPKEVEGYYLLKGWEKKVPLSSTGIFARINQKEKLELIATLKGQNFNQLEIDSDNEIISSEIVPHDQALNYRYNGLNRVCFSGEKADSLAQFIAYNSSQKITLQFVDGQKSKKFIIPDNEKDMIKKTFELYSIQKKIHILEKEQWISNKKIQTFRSLMDKNNSEQRKE